MTLSKEIRDCPNQGHRLNALLEKTAHFGAKKLWNGPQKNGSGIRVDPPLFFIMHLIYAPDSDNLVFLWTMSYSLWTM